MTHSSIAHPSTLRAFLSSIEKKPVKALSQNFLIDQNIINKFVESADLSSGDIVLEIGPGAGAITEALLNKGIKVIAVEKDSKLAHELQKRLSNTDLNIIHGDILDIDLDSLLPKDQKIKVISNLPFQLTSPILAKFLPLCNRISLLTLIMQKDLVDRILAKPHTKTYSSLSVFTHFYADTKPLFNISSSCFFPKPSVTSSALNLTLKKPALKNDKEFIEFVRKGFNQRRKMLSSSLPYPSQQVQEALNSLGLSVQLRPEDLSLDEWVNLFEYFSMDCLTKEC